jgi:hypothetical protein
LSVMQRTHFSGLKAEPIGARPNKSFKPQLTIHSSKPASFQRKRGIKRLQRLRFHYAGHLIQV